MRFGTLRICMHHKFVVSLILGASLAARALAQDADPLMAEMTRRNTAMIRDGYHVTQRWLLNPRKEQATSRIEFFVPIAGDEHTFTFWAETNEGEVAFRLLGPEGGMLASWVGRKGETTVSLLAPAGKYSAEVDRAAGVTGRAVFGVKGSAIVKCEPSLPAQEAGPSPAKGFSWPYLLVVPKEVRSRHLLVVPNNTGFATEDVEMLRASALCEVDRQLALADRLGAPLLVPLFPRPLRPEHVEGGADNLYLHALARAALETKVARLSRVDLQLLAMIDDARATLHQRHLDLDSRVFLWGFSASGSFVNRFAVLHPDRVAAVACGSPGGWPIAPAARVEGEALPYPVGIADVEALTGRAADLAALRHVSWFFYMGDQDENDAVTGRDGFSKTDEDLVFRRFGKTPVARWKDAETLYAKAGLDARFTLLSRRRPLRDSGDGEGHCPLLREGGVPALRNGPGV